MKNKIMAGMAIGMLIIGFSSLAISSPIVNGDFATGDLSGWSVTTVTAPNSLDDGSASEVTGVAVLGSSAEISQAYSWVANETVTFDWAFDYLDQPPYDDSAYFGVRGLPGGIGDFKIILAAKLTTPWDTYTHTFTNTGSGTLYFGAQDGGGDEGYNSIAYFDNIQSTNPIPEPGTMLLFSIGLVGLAGVNRKKK